MFFTAGAIRSCNPVCVHSLNGETFKAAVIDFLKCTRDTNLQQNYVGDGGETFS